VEADEQPPLSINMRALKTAVGISASLNSNIIDTISVMRKVVVDGSNTSGFQRTAIVAMGGSLDINGHSVRITNICIEEDSARRIEGTNGNTTFSLDRLGIPLVEISTEPDIRNFEEAVEVAREIGLRATLSGSIRRESDAIRQDVNFSMGYGRVEIKGISKLSLILESLIAEEKRQEVLANAIRIYLKRGSAGEVKLLDFTETFSSSQSKLIRKGISSGEKIFAGKLDLLSGLLKSDSFRIGKEIADALKLFGIAGFLHSDELPGYGITEVETSKMRNELKCNNDDAFMLISIPENRKAVAEEVIIARLEKTF
ncbi:glutamyl-tRNA(Gln) amidotransferase, subunit E, partial [mine drainage metagenome]